MAITVSWLSMGLKRVRKEISLPDHATHIRAEFGGWYSDRDIYLWWNDRGIDKCKKIVSTKQKCNLNSLGLKITPHNTEGLNN
jgi:hypothetical protein